MAILKSLFNNGAGKTASETALQLNTETAVLSTGASNLLALGAAGFSISAHTFLHPAVTANASFTAGNDAIASKGYVDAAVASVAPSITGDATYNDYVASAGTYAAAVVGNIAALSPTSGIVLGDANAAEVQRSNVLGVIIEKRAANVLRVQKDGDAVVSTDLAAYSKGDLVWLSDTAGAVTSYTALPSGANATQVGIVADPAADKISIQPRIFGEVA